MFNQGQWRSMPATMKPSPEQADVWPGAGGDVGNRTRIDGFAARCLRPIIPVQRADVRVPMERLWGERGAGQGSITVNRGQ